MPLAGVVNRHQQRVIEFVVDESDVLKGTLGEKRIRLDDDRRRRLAILGKALGRDLLDRFASIVTPETILRWHRRLVALKWTYANGAENRRGRPRVMLAIENLVVKMAKENANWGLSKIVGALNALGHTVARSTIANILERNGIAPSPDRRTSWATFLKAHAKGIVAADFMNVEV